MKLRIHWVMRGDSDIELPITSSDQATDEDIIDAIDWYEAPNHADIEIDGVDRVFDKPSEAGE